MSRDAPDEEVVFSVEHTCSTMPGSLLCGVSFTLTISHDVGLCAWASWGASKKAGRLTLSWVVREDRAANLGPREVGEPGDAGLGRVVGYVFGAVRLYRSRDRSSASLRCSLRISSRDDC